MSKLRSLSRAQLTKLAKEQGRRVHSTLFSATVFPLPVSGVTLYTCAVSKKIAVRAVDRNRLKRQCREAAKNCIRRTPPPPLAIMFLAKKTALNAPFAAIERDIMILVEKAANIGYNTRQ
jgi:ribonuclease P protein component